jgi:hypothetical protein
MKKNTFKQTTKKKKKKIPVPCGNVFSTVASEQRPTSSIDALPVFLAHGICEYKMVAQRQ